MTATASHTEHADAEVVESTALELHEATPPTALFKTDDPVEVVEQASRVANALADVIQRKALFTMIQGRAHVRVEGWQLLGSMLGVTAICVATEAVDGGYKATVEARAADGRVIGRADALCTKYEKRGPWKTADDYARLSMAQTRATSKALKGPLGFVVSLAGYETTPAEEMTFVEVDTAPEPDVPLVSTEDIVEIKAAAKGRSGAQIRMAFGACKIAMNPKAEPEAMFDHVPADKAAELVQALAGEKS